MVGSQLQCSNSFIERPSSVHYVSFSLTRRHFGRILNRPSYRLEPFCRVSFATTHSHFRQLLLECRPVQRSYTSYAHLPNVGQLQRPNTEQADSGRRLVIRPNSYNCYTNVGRFNIPIHHMPTCPMSASCGGDMQRSNGRRVRGRANVRQLSLPIRPVPTCRMSAGSACDMQRSNFITLPSSQTKQRTNKEHPDLLPHRPIKHVLQNEPTINALSSTA
jgi:hypothetical protein